MEIMKINCFCIDSEFKSGKFDYAYYWTDATEEEFKELVDNYLAENNIQEDKKFKAGMFTMYMYQHGYYVYARKDRVFRPNSPE
jgi:hypothetical protein